MSKKLPRYKKANPLVRRISRIYHGTHWFTDHEAWTLFRLFAITEAIGWTLLISAIVYRKFDMPGDTIAVSIAGTLHGLFFSLYFLFVLLTARSMEWGYKRVSIALLAGMPPYTSLAFEKFMAYHRRKNAPYIEPPANID